MLVVAVSRAGWPAGVAAPPGPFGLWRAVSDDRGWFAALGASAVGVLAVAFVALYRRAAEGEVGVATVARTGLLWCAPVLVAPPLLSLDAYSYIAQGQMLLSQLDPYTVGPAALGGGPVLDAVSPVWRDTPAPYGPLALAVLRLIAQLGDGNLPATVYLLRLVAVAAVAATAAVTVRLADPRRRPAALALVVANPLVVLHLVGGVHLDAALAGLAAAAVLAVRQRWWLLAGVAAATAFAVKLPGLVLVGYVLLSQIRANGLLTWRTARTVGVVTAVGGAYTALVPNGWGWVAALDVPGLIRHPYDPATLLGWLLHLSTRLVGLPVEFSAAVRLGRGVALAVGAAAVFVLIWRAAAPRFTQSGAALVGGALAIVALAAPTVHAWYAAWGLALVAAMATPRARWWMVGLSVVLCFTALPEPLLRHRLGIALTVGLLAVSVTGVLATAGPGLLPGPWRRLLPGSWRRLLPGSWRRLLPGSWQRLLPGPWQRLLPRSWRRVDETTPAGAVGAPRTDPLSRPGRAAA